MWFSTSELNEFYRYLQLNPKSPELDFKLRTLRKNIDNQPAGISYLLNHIEIHVARMLTVLQTLKTMLSVNSLSSILGNEAFASLHNVFGLTQQTPEAKDFEYIKQNLYLALPLCRDNWFDEQKVKALIEQFPGDNHQDLGEPSSEGQYNNLSLYSTIEKKEQQETDKLTKFVIIKMSAAHLVANVVIEEKLADSWYQILPFCFYLQKYIDTENHYYLSRAQVALTLFERHSLEEKVDDNIQSTLAEIASELRSKQKNKSSQNPKVKSEVFALSVFFMEQPFLLEYIKSQMIRNCQLGSLLYEFIQMTRVYRSKAEIKQSIVTAIERDISVLLMELDKVCEEYDVQLNFVEDYAVSLKNFYNYSAIEKLNHHQQYLSRFILQGIDVFYKLMLIDIFTQKLGDQDMTLTCLIENFLTNVNHEVKGHKKPKIYN